MLKKRFKSLRLKQISDSIARKEFFPVNQLGMRVVEVRKALGITQKQMAKKLGIKQPTYNHLEKHMEKCELSTVEKILSIFSGHLLLSISTDDTLETLVDKQAEKKAKKLLGKAYSNMALEEQSPDKKTYDERLKEFKKEIASNIDSMLWED